MPNEDFRMTDKPKWTDLFGIDPDYVKDADEEPTYTAAEVKVLTARARRQAAEEIAEAMERWFPDPHEPGEHCEDCYLVHEFARIARELGTKESV